ncbi:MAG TPA: GlsB/YeaQ/YmgE family stress response membrane protein [Candidatus Eisenbacteria bacterium]|jgi:uncharacterized membrane protein YeaQ/YmgE (transglycosylase-associated protein family)|nr:GlsB/YeaQ/YmgE family stress response membrane protein [Candidatus Eisenbacteria bacterium]
MYIIYFLLVGLFIGWMAGIIVKGSGFGVIGDIVVGIVGSMLGGWLAGILGLFPVDSVGALFVSVIGAVVLLLIIRAIRRL